MLLSIVFWEKNTHLFFQMPVAEHFSYSVNC